MKQVPKPRPNIKPKITKKYKDDEKPKQSNPNEPEDEESEEDVDLISDAPPDRNAQGGPRTFD